MRLAEVGLSQACLQLGSRVSSLLTVDDAQSLESDDGSTRREFDHEGIRRFHDLGIVAGCHVTESGEKQAFTKAVRTGNDESRQGRVVLLGDSRVGKTSTFRSLVGEPFNAKEPSTVGLTEAVVDVHNVNVDCWEKQEHGRHSAYEKAAMWSAARSVHQSSYRSAQSNMQWPLLLPVIALISFLCVAIGTFDLALSSFSLAIAMCVLVFCLIAVSSPAVMFSLPLLTAFCCEVFRAGNGGSHGDKSFHEIPYLPIVTAFLSFLWVKVKKRNVVVGCVWLVAMVALVLYAADDRTHSSSDRSFCIIHSARFWSLGTLMCSCAMTVLVCAAVTVSTPGFCAALCVMRSQWDNLACVNLARRETSQAQVSFLSFAIGIGLGLYLVKLPNRLGKFKCLSRWMSSLQIHTVLVVTSFALSRLLPDVIDTYVTPLFRLAVTEPTPLQNGLFDSCVTLLLINLTNGFVTPLLSGFIFAVIAGYSLPLIRICLLDTPICGKKVSKLKDDKPELTYTVLMLAVAATTIGSLIVFRVELFFSKLSVALALVTLLTGHDLCLLHLLCLYLAKTKGGGPEAGAVDEELDKRRHYQLSVELELCRWKIHHFPHFRLDFLDFAGHPLYESVHHVYLTASDIYLLVFSFSEAIKNGLDWQIERLTKWLSSILRQAMWAGKGSTDILVLLAATHRGNPQVTQQWLTELHRKIDRQLGLHPVYGSMLARAKGCPEPYLACVENSHKGDAAVSDLRKELLNAMHFKRDRRQYPTKIRWLYLSHCLRKEVKSGLYCVPMDTVREVAGHCYVSSSELSVAVRHLHEIGELIHQPHGHGLSSDVVLLQPAVLCNLLGHLQEIRGPKASREWLNLRRTGMATRAMLKVLFADIQVDLNLVLGMLVAFHLVCPLREHTIPASPADRFLFPCYLPPMEGDLSQLWCDYSQGLIEDQMHFDFGVLDPAPLFSQLLAVALGTYVQSNPHIVNEEVSNLRRTAAVLSVSENEQLLLYCNTVSSTQHLIQLCSRRALRNSKHCSACTEVSQQLLELQQSSFPHLKFHAGQLCPLPAPHDRTPSGDFHVLRMLNSAEEASWNKRRTAGQLWCCGRVIHLDGLNCEGEKAVPKEGEESLLVSNTQHIIMPEVVDFDNYLKVFISLHHKLHRSADYSSSSTLNTGRSSLSREYHLAIEEHFAYLSSMLPWREVLDHLVSKEVLSPQDDAYQYVTRPGLTANENRRHLIHFLCHSGNDVFKTFLTILNTVAPDMAKVCFARTSSLA